MIFTDFSFLQPFPYPYCKYVCNHFGGSIVLLTFFYSMFPTCSCQSYYFGWNRKLLRSVKSFFSYVSLFLHRPSNTTEEKRKGRKIFLPQAAPSLHFFTFSCIVAAENTKTLHKSHKIELKVSLKANYTTTCCCPHAICRYLLSSSLTFLVVASLCSLFQTFRSCRPLVYPWRWTRV